SRRGLLLGFRRGSCLPAKGTEGDFCGGEELLGLPGLDNSGGSGVGDAGNEVTDIFIARRRRHGAEVRLIAGPLGRVVAFIVVERGQFLVVGASPGVNATRDGGVSCGSFEGVRVEFGGREIAGNRHVQSSYGFKHSGFGEIICKAGPGGKMCGISWMEWVRAMGGVDRGAWRDARPGEGSCFPTLGPVHTAEMDGVASENLVRRGRVRRLWWLQGRGRERSTTGFAPQPEGTEPVFPISLSLVASRRPVCVAPRS